MTFVGIDALSRLNFGYFYRPVAETGTGQAEAYPCLGYLLTHPQGAVLFDTGMGEDPDVDAYYNPVRRPLQTALASAGASLDEVVMVVNCHLHFDHCGGNPLVGQRPIFAQGTELEAARNSPYTLPELVDESLNYKQVEGAVELLPGLHLVPTPGHTAGHQSIVWKTPDGTVVVAGQSHESASDFATSVLSSAGQYGGSEVLMPSPAWVETLLEFDPKVVMFAHDQSVWLP